KAAEKMKLASTLEVKLEKLQQELRQAEKKEQATEKTEHALQAEKEQLKKQLEDREQEAKTKEAASQAQLELLKNELREAQQAQQKARLRDAEKEATDEACARRAEEHTRKVQESEEALTKRADVAENTRESHKVNFDFAQMELPAEKQKWLTEVKRNGQNLQKAPEHLKNDKDVVLAAVEEHRLALQHASEELKKNKDVVTAAVEKDPRAFTFASEELKKDISFVKTVVQLKPKALEFAADALKQNKDVVLVAVQHSGSALQHAAEALQSDQEVVMAAVQQNGEALQYAAAAFKAEKEVVMAAVQQNGEALQYAAAAFSAEKEVVMAAVQQNGKALQFAAATLKTDKELVQAAWLQRVLRDGTEMQHAPWILRNNREFLIKAVAATRAPWLLKLSSEALKQDKELSEHLKALAGTGLVFTYYHSFDCFHNMREAFLATGASAPGGQAYEEVMKKLNETSGGSATVWFDKVHVWGFAAGHWRHPSTDCGRDMVPVPPPEGRDPMWEAMVESRIERLTPEVGSQHPCWCCRWLRVVKEKIEAGAVICCVVSNIYDDSWVDDYGAGSSEVSDRVAEHYGLKRERFRNGRPAGWGEGSIEIYEGRGRTHKYSRVAPMHPHTKLPLGEGCRWEREALDNLDCTVMAFFMP
ncbi:Pentatricopeptide repeat-containing protein, partial [Durusdinium trenchii]